MNSFRIMDTKFRILKGGKIGLAMSLAMIGGMLSLCSTSAHADTLVTLNGDSSINRVNGSSSAIGAVQDQVSTQVDTSEGGTSGTSLVDFAIHTPNVDALGIHTTINPAYDEGGYSGSSQSLARYVSTTFDNTITLFSGSNITGRTVSTDTADGSTAQLAIYTQNDYYTNNSIAYNTTGNYNYSNFVSGKLVIQGNNVIDGLVGVNYYNWDCLVSLGTQNYLFRDPLAEIQITGTDVTFGSQVNGRNIDINAGNNNANIRDVIFQDVVDTRSIDLATNGNINLNHATNIQFGGDVFGNINYLSSNSLVTLDSDADVTGNITTTANQSTGTLNFEGSSTVTGSVGTLNNMNVKGDTSYVHLNSTSGDTTTYSLDYQANKAVVQVDGLLSVNSVTMNGNTDRLDLMDRGSTQFVGTVNAGTKATGASTSTTLATRGMVGTLDFGSYLVGVNNPTSVNGRGTLYIGDNVNVNFTENPAAGLAMTNANNATLIFGGDSMVNGNLGTSTTSASTVHTIYAGNTGNTVTIANDVYVGAGKFNVGAGTVNFNGDLNGDLALGTTTAATSVESSAYSTYGNNIAAFSASEAAGTVNIAHDKTVTGSITTTTNGTGTLNFMGSSSYGSTIGTSGAKLAAVTFNSASVGNGTAVGNATNSFTETIGNNVYATTVTIGNSGETTTTAKPTSLVDATGSYDYAGATNMQVWTGGTVANIASGVMSLGDALVLNNAHDAINFGTAHIAATSFTTNGGAMSFTVNTQDITGADEAISTSAGSGLVTTAALNMSGNEKIHINYVGSLANNGTYTLISDTETTGTGTYSHVEGDGKVTDNSFVIDTKISTANTESSHGNDLILTADRTANAEYASNQLYVEKSNTVGHFSNNAATVLAGIAAVGDQTGDMVQVIQKMEIDSFGFGNNAENLAVQSKRLAPIVNASLSQSAIGANTLTLNTVSNRIADLRGDSVILPRSGATGMSAGDASTAVKGVWAKVIAATATQEKDGMYDGYKTQSAGLAMGIDREFTSKKIVAGLAFGYTNTDIDQQDFRSGDTADTDSFNLVAYASKNFEKAYVEGALSYAKHNTDSTRATAVGRTATADIDADQYTAHISGGYRFNIKDRATVTPFLTLDYTHLAQDGYTETGADAINLKVDEMSTNRTTVGGGFRVGTTVEKGSAVLRPELKLAAYHVSGGSNTDITAQYVGGGEKFVTPGTDLSSMMYNVGFGLKAETSKSTSLGVSIDYDRSSDGLFEGYTGQLVARYEF